MPDCFNLIYGSGLRRWVAAIFCGSVFLLPMVNAASDSDARKSALFVWPEVTRQTRPWTYWWWHGSAVDKTNLAHELERYRQAGLGGVHIIPIYGVKGYEDKSIDYLTPEWMDMLAYTVREADRLGLGVDMTMGSGWCFGGPHVTDLEANAAVVVRTFEIAASGQFHERFNRQDTQALAAFSPGGKYQNLLPSLSRDGTVNWSPPEGNWRVYAVSQKPSGQKVKRAAPGGQGHMLNLLYPEAMEHYLAWFNGAFANYVGPRPRAMYHDSYEYRSDWAPDFLDSFAKLRGYRLETELPALLGKSPSGMNSDHIARVKSDYRETVSDVMACETLPLWTDWSHRHGFLTRNEAHGSPGNWLDLYAVADVPETEMFYKDRNKLVSKFASSAAHVSGRQLVASETGTWLKEHFTETLSDMKYLLDDLYLSGVNHVFYHGTCYSPDEAAWPGWLFYASFEMNPRNSIWRDVPALNAYVARCQSVLQAGRSGNDLLVYWPIYDVWHDATGLVKPFTVHARDWFEDQPIGRTAEQLWSRGYAFDYVSDRQLAEAKARRGKLRLPGGDYGAVLVPPTHHMPLQTLSKLRTLAQAGVPVVFQERLPIDVPGWGKLEERRSAFQELLQDPVFHRAAGEAGGDSTRPGATVVTGDLGTALSVVGVKREPMFDRPGLMCVKRIGPNADYYFVVNRSETNAICGWVPVSVRPSCIIAMDPLSGQTGAATIRPRSEGGAEIYLTLQPGQSVILGCVREGTPEQATWPLWNAATSPVELTGAWHIEFLQGGPGLPTAAEIQKLVSWTQLGDANGQRFAGTARYQLSFDAPQEHPGNWKLDLGRVCQSARVRLNGDDLGTLITPPFAVVATLKPKGNVLEVEVTNVSANRIRDLDRAHVNWKNFLDINFVNLDYKPFDASNWPLTDSGLLGPVTVTPLTMMQPY